MKKRLYKLKKLHKKTNAIVESRDYMGDMDAAKLAKPIISKFAYFKYSQR